MPGRYNGFTAQTNKVPLVPPDPDARGRWCTLGPVFNKDTVSATIIVYLESTQGDSVEFFRGTIAANGVWSWFREEYLEDHQHFTLALSAVVTTNQLIVHSCWQ